MCWSRTSSKSDYGTLRILFQGGCSKNYIHVIFWVAAFAFVKTAIHCILEMPLTRGFLRRSYAKKSVSENGPYSCKNNRRNLHVRPHYAGLVCSSGWILFCLFYGMRLRKPAFLQTCLQKLWPENHTSGFFWNDHNLCHSWINVRSIAASRLAQNAPLEHFAGLQPSLPRFQQWAWLQLSFTILTIMGFRFMSLLFSGCVSCALIFLLPSLPSCFLFSPLCELSSNWFLQETLKTERIFSPLYYIKIKNLIK